MKNLLYYPYFEVKDESWIKSALLLSDKIEFIVPYRGRADLSDTTKMILEETDLIEFHQPRRREADIASMNTIMLLEDILDNPRRFNERILGSRNLLEELRDSNSFSVILYRAKYNYDFFRFCLDNGFGRRCEEGILLSEHIGNLYMTLLTNFIGEDKNIECVTNYESMDRYNVYLRSKNVHLNELTIADEYKNIIMNSRMNMEFPQNLNQIEFEKIIELRNSSEFKECQSAFHRDMNNYLLEVESGQFNFGFDDYINEAYTEYKKQLLLLGCGLVGISIGVWFTAPVAPIIAAGECLALPTIISNCRKLVASSNDNRFTRKFLCNINNLN